MARRRRLSDNRVLVELIEQGIAARQQKEKAFVDLATRFRAASDPAQVSPWVKNWGSLSSVSDAADRNVVPASRRRPRPPDRAHARSQHQP